MAELRLLVSSLGHTEVATYIQSGNVLFTPASGADPADPADPAELTELAAGLRRAIAGSFPLDPPTVVLPRDELADVIAANPYPDEPEPRYVHCVFLPAPLDEAAVAKVHEIAAVAAAGTRDELTVRGRVVYLHTPDGFGDSELGKALVAKRNSPIGIGTARNWSTVTKLLALCDG